MQEKLDVKAIRERMKLTQAELAAKLHVDVGTVSRWERNISRPLKVYRLIIAEILEQFLMSEV